MSVNKYILSVKMREAKRLLTTGQLTAKEIAARMNFSSLNYLCYAYQTFYGHPPRKDHRKS